MKDNIRITFGFPAGGTSVAVNVSVFIGRQMIMYYILYFGDIQSASGQIGRNKHMATSVAEFI